MNTSVFGCSKPLRSASCGITVPPPRFASTGFPRHLRLGGRFFAFFDGMALLTLVACRYRGSHAGTSWEPQGNLAVVPPYGIRRYYGEVPLRSRWSPGAVGGMGLSQAPLSGHQAPPPASRPSAPQSLAWFASRLARSASDGFPIEGILHP